MIDIWCQCNTRAVCGRIMCSSVLTSRNADHTMCPARCRAQMQTDVFVRLTLVWCSLAVPVFLKFLYMLVPMFQRLGPLLNTVYNMMQELVAFALPFAVIVGDAKRACLPCH